MDGWMDLVFTFSLFCKIFKNVIPCILSADNDRKSLVEQSALSGISTSPPVHLILPISVTALAPLVRPKCTTKDGFGEKNKFTGSKLSHNTGNRHRRSMSERQIA